jgi:glucose/arabinose dehydrogenase
MMRFLLIVLIASLLAACSISPDATSSTTQTSVADISTLRSRVATNAPPTSVPTQTSSVTPTTPPTPTESLTPTPFLGFPSPASVAWKPVIAGLVRPVGITHAGDGSDRLFIIEQAGHIHIFKDGTLLSTPFLNIQERVGSTGNEQGLLGLAFSPRYSENGLFFVNYTDLQGNTVIARFERSTENPDLADPESETIILTIDQPFPNHNGGMLAFGPDGFLYIGMGDGGSAGDPFGNGQSLNTLLGKILRIDVNSGDPYSSPVDNLFVEGQRPEIWAFGLRNPWRFSFDRLTGDLYIGDVGQNRLEEIDFLPAGSPAGSNFGWSFFEGTEPYEEVIPTDLSIIYPVAQYTHSNGCVVTGGVVYRGNNLPEFYGIYLYGDYCYGSIWGLYKDEQGVWQNQLLFENTGNISSFGEDENGEIYLADLNGIIYRLEKP